MGASLFKMSKDFRAIPAFSLSQRAEASPLARCQLPPGGSLGLYWYLAINLPLVPHRGRESNKRLPPGGSWIREGLEKHRAKTEGESGVIDRL